MSKWQPIETAPKDGTEIDVWAFLLRNGIKNGSRWPNIKWNDGGWEAFEDGLFFKVESDDYVISHWMRIHGPEE